MVSFIHIFDSAGPPKNLSKGGPFPCLECNFFAGTALLAWHNVAWHSGAWHNVAWHSKIDNKREKFSGMDVNNLVYSAMQQTYNPDE